VFGRDSLFNQMVIAVVMTHAGANLDQAAVIGEPNSSVNIGQEVMS
jgi:hypothetical protein